MPTVLSYLHYQDVTAAYRYRTDSLLTRDVMKTMPQDTLRQMTRPCSFRWMISSFSSSAQSMSQSIPRADRPLVRSHMTFSTPPRMG